MTAFDGVQEWHDPDLPSVIAGLEAARARAFEEYLEVRLDLGDLQGSTPGRASLTRGEVLARALRALGVPAERVPLTDGEAAAVLR